MIAGPRDGYSIHPKKDMAAISKMTMPLSLRKLDDNVTDDTHYFLLVVNDATPCPTRQ